MSWLCGNPRDNVGKASLEALVFFRGTVVRVGSIEGFERLHPGVWQWEFMESSLCINDMPTIYMLWECGSSHKYKRTRRYFRRVIDTRFASSRNFRSLFDTTSKIVRKYSENTRWSRDAFARLLSIWSCRGHCESFRRASTEGRQYVEIT